MLKSIAWRLRISFLMAGFLPLLLVGGLAQLFMNSINHKKIQNLFNEIYQRVEEENHEFFKNKNRGLIFLSRLLFIKEKISEDFDTDGLLAENFLGFQEKNPGLTEIYAIKFVPAENEKKQYWLNFASSNPKRMGTKIEVNFAKKLSAHRNKYLIKPFEATKTEIIRSKIDGQLSFRFLIPFRGEDEEIHFLVALLDPNILGNTLRKILFSGIKQNQKQFVSLIDQNNSNLFSLPRLFKKNSFELKKILQNATETKTMREIKINQETYFLTVHRLKSFPFRIVILQSKNISYQWLIYAQKVFFGTLFILLALILITSQKLSSTLLKPLEYLELACKNLSSGEFQFKWKDYGLKEIDKLGNQFEIMSIYLCKAQDELEISNKDLEKKVEIRTLDLAEKNKKLGRISKELSKYLDPQLHASIFKGEMLTQGKPQRKKLTVFFSDIKGFTSTSEDLEAEDLSKMLNNYLDEMAKIVQEYNGTLDKFIGDAVMVFFGDPKSSGEKEDALKCVQMALQMQFRIAQLRIEWAKKGFTSPFHIRCGINTGYCTVGNFGSENRMDYTIVGRHVNLASRLESNAMVDGVLISKDTYLLVRDKIICKPFSKINVKGIQRDIDTFLALRTREKRKSSNFLSMKKSGFNLTLDFKKIASKDRGIILGFLTRTLSTFYNEESEVESSETLNHEKNNPHPKAPPTID